MRRLCAVLLVSYAFLIAFGDAFKLHRWVPVPLVVLLVGVVVVGWALMLRGRVRLAPGYFTASDLLLVAYILSIGITLLLSTQVASKNVNHFVAYAVVIGFYYFFVKFLLAADDTYEYYGSAVRTALASSVALASAYALLEFVDSNFLRLGLTSLVSFPEEQRSYDALFLVFIRARGFMVESGFLALFLNVAAPISLLHVRHTLGTPAALAFALIVAGALAVTFSVAGFTFLAIGLAVGALLYVYDRAVVLVPLRSVVVLAAVVVVLLALGIALPPGVWAPIIGKLSLSDLSSGSARLAGWTQGLSVALEHPLLGTGIGSTSRETGSGLISFYLTMLKEGGVVTLGTIVLFLGGVLHRIGALPVTSRYKYAYAASFIAAVCHYAVISDVWYPWLWLLCALIACDARQASNHRVTLG